MYKSKFLGKSGMLIQQRGIGLAFQSVGIETLAKQSCK